MCRSLHNHSHEHNHDHMHNHCRCHNCTCGDAHTRIEEKLDILIGALLELGEDDEDDEEDYMDEEHYDEHPRCCR